LLGRSIKAYLAEHLSTLVDSGEVNDIKEVGGTLTKQLVEVMTEDFLASRRPRGQVKNEISA